MKYEYKTKNRVSNDHFMDLHAAKNVTDLLCLDTSKLIKGFIQKSFLNPFGFIMLSDLQIKIWQVIQLNNQLWNFDATGSIIKNVRNQKAPYLYSLVVHDIIEKSHTCSRVYYYKPYHQFNSFKFDNNQRNFRIKYNKKK